MSHKHDIPNSRNHKYAIHSSSSTTKSQTHENAEMQITKSMQYRKYSSSTPISSFADSRIECRSRLSHKHDIPNSQICRFSNTFSQIHGSSNITSQDHVSSNTISQVHNFTYFTKSHGCLTSMTLKIPRAQFISLRPKTTQNIRTPFRGE